MPESVENSDESSNDELLLLQMSVMARAIGLLSQIVFDADHHDQPVIVKTIKLLSHSIDTVADVLLVDENASDKPA